MLGERNSRLPVCKDKDPMRMDLSGSPPPSRDEEVGWGGEDEEAPKARSLGTGDDFDR